MKQSIALVTVVVKDYDEAIDFYINRLGFRLKEDTHLGAGKRWVVVHPNGSEGTSILLAKAKNQQEEHSIGNQTGGRVCLFLHTDDFQRDFENMSKKGVVFLEEPRHESYGVVAVFQDLYGNKWDLLELKSK